MGCGDGHRILRTLAGREKSVSPISFDRTGKWLVPLPTLLDLSVVQSYQKHVGPECAMLVPSMRDPEIIEAELMEISAIADDTTKFERIVTWCAAHPNEVAFAIHHLLSRHRGQRLSEGAEPSSREER